MRRLVSRQTISIDDLLEVDSELFSSVYISCTIDEILGVNLNFCFAEFRLNFSAPRPPGLELTYLINNNINTYIHTYIYP